jgi:hypothetical protein
MGTATTLAVNGDEALGADVVADEGVSDPVLEAALEGFGLQRDQQPANTIA